MKKTLLIKAFSVVLILSLLVGCGTTNNSPAGEMTSSTEEKTTENSVEEYNETENEDSVDVENDLDQSPNQTEGSVEDFEDQTIEEEFDTEIEETEEDGLTTTQRTSINMLNYISVLTEQINESKGSRIYLESVQSDLLNNLYLTAVDTKTKSQINNLWGTIDGYRMISVKRDRLNYIYEQNKAQAIRQAIPNPLGLLSTVQSGSMLKAAASVLYMAVDSAASYQSASTQTELKYLQDNWELDDEEASELSNSQLNLLNYMIDMVHANEFPAEWALNNDAVKAFVEWKNEDNIVRKITWLESNEETYQEFRTYWLELAKSYYEYAEEADAADKYEAYEKCLMAIEKYEKVATRIFLKDYDYAQTLPMIILASREIEDEKTYVETADRYAEVILNNCDGEDWALRYFVAQIYIDLYAYTENEEYLNNAYGIVRDNVNILVKEQEKLNASYLADVEKEEAGEDATKREKQEVKEYNKMLEEKREVELPPVNEAFYLNCDLLFALMDEINVSQKERKNIDSIIHEDGAKIFLTDALDNRFWANSDVEEILAQEIEIEFDGKKLVVPATCMTDRTKIEVKVSSGNTIDEWNVVQVKRPKNAECSEFMVTLESEQGKDYKYSAGEKITISIIPVADTPDETIEFSYKVIEKKTLGIFKSISFERVMK